MKINNILNAKQHKQISLFNIAPEKSDRVNLLDYLSCTGHPEYWFLGETSLERAT